MSAGEPMGAEKICQSAISQVGLPCLVTTHCTPLHRAAPPPALAAPSTPPAPTVAPVVVPPLLAPTGPPVGPVLPSSVASRSVMPEHPSADTRVINAPAHIPVAKPMVVFIAVSPIAARRSVPGC